MKQVDLETSQGTIRVELDDEKAPVTVKNFLTYVENGHLRRHGVPPRHQGLHGPGRRLRARHEAKADRLDDPERGQQRPEERRYTLAMARTSAPHSATAQFFINAPTTSS